MKPNDIIKCKQTGRLGTIVRVSAKTGKLAIVRWQLSQLHTTEQISNLELYIEKA